MLDCIIIDAPPVAGFADAILFAASSDGVLFAVESGKTRTAIALAALTLQAPSPSPTGPHADEGAAPVPPNMPNEGLQRPAESET